MRRRALARRHRSEIEGEWVVGDEPFIASPHAGDRERLTALAFLWNRGEITLFSDVLAARGVHTSGWIFGEPSRMSADSKVVFGRALCGGVPVTYRLEL